MYLQFIDALGVEQNTYNTQFVHRIIVCNGARRKQFYFFQAVRAITNPFESHTLLICYGRATDTNVNCFICRRTQRRDTLRV